jgi:glutathione synthase/RimK-type ligase-like ATP-grasp enzyme
METLVVVTHAKDWPLKVKGGRVVTARSYLMDPEFGNLKRAKVFNLCRQYRYQTYGYYVSLLAEARGHKPIPTVATTQDLRSPALMRMASDELQEKIQKSLGPIQSERFVLSIYFGRNVAKRHDELAMALFKLFPAPFLRATFFRERQWELQSLSAIPASAIPEEHRDFAFAAAQSFFAQPNRHRARPRARFDLAILHDAKDPTAPSDEKAIERFERAAEEMDIDVEVISKEDYGRVPQFDALFIRATTAVNHYTYRFSSRAAAEGLVVIDDPTSILRCTNKVYLAELFARNGIPTPRTRIVHKENFLEAVQNIGFPCILKQPDSSSSLGVVKADQADELRQYASQLFETSELLIAQEFLPTEFDWRIGILDRRPLFAARYFMAPNHWQIIKRDDFGHEAYGSSDVLPVEEVPHRGLRLALRAANLVGDGFYGVDLKQVGKDWYLIEINDNPSVEHHVEDRYLHEELYRRVMAVFLRRIEERKEGRAYR